MGRTHADELKQHAVAYVNSDGNGRGFFRTQGSHSLENFVNGVMKDITDPETNMTVWRRARLADLSRANSKARAELKSRPDLLIGALGSGSDYTVFVHHLGIASLNIGYGGEDANGGQYHSVYDDFYWYTHFEDTDFSYARALAQTGGTMILRLADNDLLPFQYTDFAETVRGYLGEPEALANDQRTTIKDRNSDIDEGIYQALADPKKKNIPPSKEPFPRYLNLRLWRTRPTISPGPPKHTNKPFSPLPTRRPQQ